MDNYTRLKDVPLYENPPKSPLATGGFTFPRSDLSSWISRYWTQGILALTSFANGASLWHSTGSRRQAAKEGRLWTLDFSTPGMPYTMVAKFPGTPSIAEESFLKRKLTPRTGKRYKR